MHVPSQFVLTSRGVSSLCDASQAYIGQLAKQGLIPHVVASDGTRLFQEEAAVIVARHKAAGLARRGRRRAT